METTYTVQKPGEVSTTPDRKPDVYPRRTDGRMNSRKTIAQDKIVSIPVSGIPNGSLNFALLNASLIAVTVSAGNTSGSSSVTSGWKVLAIYPTTNQDQIVKSVAISGTTLTVTLIAAATADNHFNCLVIAP